jgi:uncharacterized membrane protein required for colicin V production
LETFNFIAGLTSIISFILAIFVTTKVYNISKTITKINNYQKTERNVSGKVVEQKASGIGNKQVGGDYHGS